MGIFLFTTASITALGPTEPPIQWVPGALSLWVKWQGREADHSPPSSAKIKEWVELYLHSPNMPSWRGAQLKHRDNFTSWRGETKGALNFYFLLCGLLPFSCDIYNISLINSHPTRIYWPLFKLSTHHITSIFTIPSSDLVLTRLSIFITRVLLLLFLLLLLLLLLLLGLYISYALLSHQQGFSHSVVLNHGIGATSNLCLSTGNSKWRSNQLSHCCYMQVSVRIPDHCQYSHVVLQQEPSRHKCPGSHVTVELAVTFWRVTADGSC
jgi:hypothetical protein